ncbi:uncharacterized protein LOC123538654 isoform X6 [Mercenaria mercenaria]|uniref:uncharacterized protein LOC123538654 isoform X6 n=1 Tax=Mercenaria mercenaria TaxID=6596 RepID=UPI00234F0CD5|nr:uncharacterized protein LOC123538654 isoform X6 [Mercenaria mercenaria]
MRPNGVGHTNASTLLESHWNNFLTDKMCLVLVGIDLSLTGEKVADIRMLIGFSISTVLLLICIAVLVIILLKRTRPCQRHRKQQNQGDVHVKTKVEMTEISATEAENVKGCARTSSSEKPYEDLHEERDAGQEHQYLGIAVQNEDSTGDPKYQNTPQNSEMKIKLCKN